MRSDMKIKIRPTVNSTARAPSAEASEHVLDLASPCTTNESSCFKENINFNKSDSPKLCLEPLQMKRKKRGGGYNLRRSLAWDKAFFTEEGVLDPVELSVINGASCNGEGDHCKDGKKDWSSPKVKSSPLNTKTTTSLTSHKFPTHLGNKSASKCGDCPRPLPSPSLKRPANVNVSKASGKDLKLPKVPISATTMSSVLKANCVKHNQVTKADFNIQKISGSSSFPKSLQNNQSASKACSVRPAPYLVGNSGNLSSKRPSSINMSPVLVGNADNSGSKMISDITTPARPVNSSEAQQESTSFAVPFSRNAHVGGGTTMHPSQNQPMKPSGLRMPSPSLSFFSQPKRSVFQDLPLRRKETDVCGSQKPENSRLRDILRRTPKIDSNITASAISSKAITSSSGCMTSSHISAEEVIRSNMKQIPMQKIPDISKNRFGELQKVDTEFPSVSGSCCEQVMDDTFLSNAIEGYRENDCKPDYHQLHRKKTDTSNDSLGETDKNVSHLNGSLFAGSESVIEPSEHSRAKAENSYFESDHIRANLLNETACTEVPSDTLIDNAVFATSVKSCMSGINLIPAVDDDTNQSGNVMEPLRNVKSNTGDRLLPDKQLCLRNSQQQKSVEKLKVMDTKTASSLSPGKVHDCNLEDKMTGKLLFSTEFKFVDDSLSSESHSSLADVSFKDFKGNANLLSCSPANSNLLNSLHQDTQRTDFDYCSSFPESTICQGSQENTFGKVTETGAIVSNGSADKQLTSNTALKESEFCTDNFRNLKDSESVELRSPERNVLNECVFKESERLTLPGSEFVAENVVNHNQRLHFENFLPTECQADASYVDNVKGSAEGSVRGKTDLYLSTSTSSSFSSNEAPLRNENSNDAHGIEDYTADVIPDLSRVGPISETDESHKLENVKVEVASTPSNKQGDGLNDKSRLSILPQNAIPFSDEWLAAIEAAGEDILTMKSGAVQNSPPDKSLPELGPYSPVKRKNNQIGPFDCTKKITNIVPSGPN